MEDDMKKYSFIIPVYNTDLEHLNECVSSIVEESFGTYEIILIDDGSPNKEIELFCRKLETKNNNIKYVYQENAGSAVARNTGLDCCEGDFVIFVDADDVLEKGIAKHILNYEQEFDILLLNYSNWSTEGEIEFSLDENVEYSKLKQDIYKSILFAPKMFNDYVMGSIWSKVFNRKFIEKNKIRFVPELRKAQDRRFMIESFYYAKNIKYCSVPSYKYRLNATSICHTFNNKMIDYYLRLLKSMRSFCEEKKLPYDVTKYMEYNIVMELLPLSVFHIDNPCTDREKMKQFKEIAEQFDFYPAVKKLKFSDFASINGKIKLLMCKLHCMGFIKYIIERNQKRERQSLY